MSEKHINNDSECNPPVAKFILDMRANNISESTISWYVDKIKNIERINAKPFEKWDESDVKKTMAEINTRKLSGWTKYGYRSALRKFFRTIGKQDIVAWIKLEPQKIKVEYNIMTKDEIQRMIDSAKTLRDKAFIATLYGSGCRIGEIKDLKVNDITWDEYGCILNVKKSKTEPRPIRIVEFSGYLQLYLKRRLFISEYVWLAEDNYWKGEKMSVKALRKILRRVRQISKIEKPVNPHNFRHSRATEMSRYLTDQEMRIWAGWSRNSRMPSLYSHLSSRDIDNKIIELSLHKRII